MAKYLVRMTACSYCNPHQIEAWNCSECKKITMTHVKVIKNSTEDTLGYIAVSDQLDAVGIVLN
jgi:hypothetical protein